MKKVLNGFIILLIETVIILGICYLMFLFPIMNTTIKIIGTIVMISIFILSIIFIIRNSYYIERKINNEQRNK
jgi:hypothetical protein